MTTSSPHEDRTKALGWLAYGGKLAWALHGDRVRHSDVIWQLLVDAVEVIDKTPDQDRRWLTSGQRSGGWNMVGMSRAELIDIEKNRLMSGMKPFDGVARYGIQKDDIERALGVLEWLRWCSNARLSDRLTKAAVALARGGDTEVVHRLYCPTRKPHRQNIHEIRVRTVGFILTGLKNELGIVPGEGISFQEVYSHAD
ncbi:hypothetical protein [Bradyrhizobium sp. DASA03007]|uniref:hypothetical protein n=1 Tax=unclassified Bradyrhizobium TaxID=2631580 RepID=UPI003F7225E8